MTYDRAEKDYVEFLTHCFPLALAGTTIVLDCAHGATYRVAPAVFQRLGARVVTSSVRPDGININAGCGALHPRGCDAASAPRAPTSASPSTATATG